MLLNTIATRIMGWTWKDVDEKRSNIHWRLEVQQDE